MCSLASLLGGENSELVSKKKSFVDEICYEWEMSDDVFKPNELFLLWLLADYVAWTKNDRFTMSKTFKFVQMTTHTARLKLPFNLILFLGRL